jgi:hypothetical protein
MSVYFTNMNITLIYENGASRPFRIASDPNNNNLGTVRRARGDDVSSIS